MSNERQPQAERSEQMMANVTVSNSAQLAAALASARGGETIVLAAGSYSDLVLSNRHFTSNVTVVSADPGNQASIRTINLNGVTNLTFRSVDIGYGIAPGTPNWIKLNEVNNANNLVFDDVLFHGSLDNDPTNDGNGLSVTNSNAITIMNSEFTQLNRSVLVGSSTNIQVINNNFHDLRLGGVHFSDVQNVKIMSNRFTNFFPVGDDHPDAIQFWEGGTTRPSTDIVISDNVILQGSGRSLQGIFIEDDNAGFRYKNVTITNNLVYLQGYNGIYVGGADNVKVEGNTVVSPTSDNFLNRIFLERVNGATVHHNVTDIYLSSANTGVSVQKNVVLVDQPSRAAQLRDLDAWQNARIEGLVLDNVGYQPPKTPVPLDPPRLGTAAVDGFYLGATLDASDRINGFEGADQVGLQGDYNLTLGSENLVAIEVLALLPGNDARFGDLSGAYYNYNITTVDANIAAGETLTVSMTKLRPGENVVFDGSAETDGKFVFHGGRGNDVLIGGARDDGFLFGDGAFTPADRIDGRGGANDQVAFRGNYAGGVAFQADTIVNVEALALMAGNDTRFGPAGDGFGYTITLHDGNVAAGGMLTVTGTTLRSTERMVIDGSSETNGTLRLWAGAANDVLTAGAGNDNLYGGRGADVLDGRGGSDTFLYLSAADSTGRECDRLIGFDCRVDKIDLKIDHGGITDVIGSGSLSSANFDSDLARLLADVLGAGDAVALTASAGDYAGRSFLIVDMDGKAGYTSGDDLVLELVNPVAPITVGMDFFV